MQSGPASAEWISTITSNLLTSIALTSMLGELASAMSRVELQDRNNISGIYCKSHPCTCTMLPAVTFSELTYCNKIMLLMNQTTLTLLKGAHSDPG